MPEIIGSLDDEIRDLVAKVLEIDPSKLSDKAHFVEDLGMDSMLALEILASIEKKYKIQIPEESLPKMTTLHEIIVLAKEILAKKK